MDVFGVAPESITELERCFGTAAREYTAASASGKPEHARELKAKLEREIQQAGGFAAVDVAVVHYFEPDIPPDLTFNITPAGTKSIKYLPDPKGDVPDPGGLLESWRDYEKLGGALAFDDQLAATPPCPAHHCLYGFDHPRLRSYGETFSQKVPARRKELVKVMRTDKDPKDRAAAAYLLAHLPKARDVMRALLPHLRDPAPYVRNSVLRVLAAMAENGEAPAIPMKRVLPFLQSHVLTDRNKAVAIVAALAPDKRHRKRLIRRAGCDLVRLLELKQPNQAGFAHEALVKLAGEDLGAEPGVWRKWLKDQRVACRPEPEISPGTLCPSAR